MKKFEKYINEMKTIIPPETLVEDTIDKINEIERKKEKKKYGRFEIMNKIKKVILGLAITLGFVTTCCAAYTIISGNYVILEKIGIKLSHNYEENSQQINQSVESDNIKLKLKSIGITDSFIVAEYNIDTKKELQNDIKLNVNSISFYNQDIDSTVEFDFDSNQYVEKNEDGSYTLFDICYIKDVKNSNQKMAGVLFDDEIANYSEQLTSYLFGEIYTNGVRKYSRENVKIIIDVLDVETADGVFIDGSTENNDWLFEFTVNCERNVGNLLTDQNQMETFEYEDLTVDKNRITEGALGTYVFTTVYEQYDNNESDNIEYVDVVITDQNGNIINTMYKKEKNILPNEDINCGRKVEFYMFLDPDESVTEYNIQIVKNNKKVRKF